MNLRAGHLGSMARRRVPALVLLCGLLLPGPRPSLAMGANPLEYEVKAAMLYNFIRFVEWPPNSWKDARAPLVVGVFGTDPFGAILDQTLQEKTYGGRTIQIRRVRSVSEIDGCNVLFIARSERKHLTEILRPAHTAGMLTISDMEDFVSSGGAIGFVLVDSKIRFEINSSSASRAGLTISSKLLRLALSTERRGGG